MHARNDLQDIRLVRSDNNNSRIHSNSVKQETEFHWSEKAIPFYGMTCMSIVSGSTPRCCLNRHLVWGLRFP